MIGWIVLGVVALVAFIFFVYFNRFAILGNRIDNSLSQIDVQLKRRADLIPNLLESVKGYMKHEKGIIKEVTDARKALVSAGNIEGKVKANDKLESALKSIFALAENYPNLKANENFLELQRELTTTEDKIAYSRQYYNDSILSYNDLCKTFPGALFAKIYGKKPREYLQITASERKNVEVKF
ncbi:LemA family protein [Candidatus Pacearchaeota archaeon]|jgi:LemA protein|nr:LemA family protein [Candidatus Pacearchaeota archaeon]